jgi:hypothetical protein
VVAKQGGSMTPPRQLLDAPDLSGASARLERVPLRLSWQPMPGARGYRAQVFAFDSDEQLLLDGRFDDISAKWVDLPDGRYRLRVRAIDELGLEGLVATKAFELKARPEPPFTVAPRAGALVHGEKISFAWTRSSPAARYRLQLAASPDFASPVLDKADFETPPHELALPPGDYHWRMASITADGDQGPFGDAQAFTLRPIPPSPALEPAQASDEGIVFRWKAPAAGAKVQYQVARDAAFSQIEFDETSNASEGRLDKPAPGTYFLRVRTIDADGFAGNFGVPQQIEVPRSNAWMLVPAALLLLLLM